MEVMLALRRLRDSLALVVLICVFKLIDANAACVIYGILIRYVTIFEGLEILFDVLVDSLLGRFLVSHSLFASFLFCG